MTLIHTPPHYLAEALHLPPLPKPPVPLPSGSVCAMTGEPITAGYPVMDVTTDATNEYMDTFRGRPTGYVSEAVARCMKGSNPRAGMAINGSHVIFESGGSLESFKPLIAQAAADAQGRPSWRDLVRNEFPSRIDRRCLILLTTDTKKRLWPRSVVGALGDRTPIYIYDSGAALAGVFYHSFSRILSALDLIESIYNLGFSKRGIGAGLLAETAHADTVGLKATIDHETALASIRSTPEFPFALLIAQKDTPK